MNERKRERGRIIQSLQAQVLNCYTKLVINSVFQWILLSADYILKKEADCFQESTEQFNANKYCNE